MDLAENPFSVLGTETSPEQSSHGQRCESTKSSQYEEFCSRRCKTKQREVKRYGSGTYGQTFRGKRSSLNCTTKL